MFKMDTKPVLSRGAMSNLICLLLKRTKVNSFSHIVLDQSAWSVWALLVAYFISSCTKTILKIWRWFMIVSKSFCYFELWQKKIMMVISNKWKNLKLRPFGFLLPFCLALSKNQHNLKEICLQSPLLWFLFLLKLKSLVLCV